MKAVLLFKEKRFLLNLETGKTAIAEIKIWGVPESKDYPGGKKFSLFLIEDGIVVFGIDNHRPKGPHLHFDGQEFPYLFQDEARLVRDFWELSGKAGYEP